MISPFGRGFDPLRVHACVFYDVPYRKAPVDDDSFDRQALLVGIRAVRFYARYAALCEYPAAVSIARSRRSQESMCRRFLR